MRLIDADALWMEVIHTMDYCDDILEIIEHQKTIEPTRSNTPNTLETLDCIGRQEAIDEANAWLLDCFGEQKQNRSCGLIRRLEDLPSAQMEYEPVKVEDFAKTLSENLPCGFMAWHGDAFTLIKEMGFVICKKTM